MELQYRWLGLYVRDWKKMAAFYRDTVGLKQQSEDNDSTLFVTSNGFEIELFDVTQRPDADKTFYEQDRPVLLGFNVTDVEGAVVELKAKDVTFAMDVQTRAWGKFVYFTDPEGNQIQLFQFIKKA
jgi:predicted enzyme related to lactoylglutathione lyase